MWVVCFLTRDYKMLKHLKLFLGTREKLLDHYIIRFTVNNIIEFIATDGYAMCINRVVSPHGSVGKTIAISIKDFNDIAKLDTEDMSFLLLNTNLTIFSGNLTLSIHTLSTSFVPNIDNILSIPIVNKAKPYFQVSQIEKITRYCELMETDEIKFNFAGDELPMRVSGQDGAWEIITMPLGDKHV